MRAPSESSKLGALSTLSELSSALPSDASSVPNDSLSDLPRELPAAHGAHQVGQSAPLNELRSNASTLAASGAWRMPSESTSHPLVAPKRAARRTAEQVVERAAEKARGGASRASSEPPKLGASSTQSELSSEPPATIGRVKRATERVAEGAAKRRMEHTQRVTERAAE